MRPVTLVVDGTAGPSQSPVCPLDLYLTPFQVTLQTIVQGTVDYTVRYTKDDVWASDFDPNTAQWVTVTGMTDATADDEETLISPVTAVQIILNSGTGSVQLRVIQAGVQ